MHIVLTLIAEALWTRVRAVFARACMALGGAAGIAAMRQLTERTRRSIVARLAPLEAMVRKLLLVEAASFADEARVRVQIDARRGASPCPRPARGPLQQHSFDLSQPETWPARFALAPPVDPLVVADDRAPHIRALWNETAGDTHARIALACEDESVGVRVCHPTYRLARRLEALRRVLDDPLPHARRLARLLVRTRRRFPEIAHRYAMAPARTGNCDAEDPRLTLECMANALTVAPRFSSA